MDPVRRWRADLLNPRGKNKNKKKSVNWKVIRIYLVPLCADFGAPAAGASRAASPLSDVTDISFRYFHHVYVFWRRLKNSQGDAFRPPERSFPVISPPAAHLKPDAKVISWDPEVVKTNSPHANINVAKWNVRRKNASRAPANIKSHLNELL